MSVRILLHPGRSYPKVDLCVQREGLRVPPVSGDAATHPSISTGLLKHPGERKRKRKYYGKAL